MWSMRAVICGDNMLGYTFKNYGGSFSADYCGDIQNKQISGQINQPGKPYVSPYSPKEILDMADDENGFVFPDTYENQSDHMKGQCVSLVRGAVPGLDVQTSKWEEGDELNELNVTSLLPGTAIGYGFNFNGQYTSMPTGNHVAIFVSYDPESDKIDIIDQQHHNGGIVRPAEKRSVSFSNRASGKEWVIVTRKAK